MKIGGYTSLNSTCIQYQMRDLLEGFRLLGHDVEVLHEDCRWTDYGDISIEYLMRFVEDWKPDLMVQINGNRFHHPPLGPEVPWVNVAMDRMPWLLGTDPRNYPTRYEHWGPKDLTVASFTPLAAELAAAGAKDVRYLPVGYNRSIFNADPEPIDPRFQVDIAMLCNMSPGIETRLNRIGHRWDAIAPALWMARHYGTKVGLYGAGWDQWEETRPYYVCNPTNGKETKAIYQQAKLHLHANEDMILHMRPLECLGSGGAVAIYTPPWWYNEHDSNREGLGGVLSYKCVRGLEYALEHAVHREWPTVASMHSTAARAATIIRCMREKGALP